MRCAAPPRHHLPDAAPRHLAGLEPYDPPGFVIAYSLAANTAFNQSEAWQTALLVVTAAMPLSPPGPVLLRNARILDTVHGICSEGTHAVLVVDGHILSCSKQALG